MILRWRNPDNDRCYEAVVGEDLFGECFLWRGWCGADGKRGGEKKDVFTWEVDCLRALRRVIRRRERRGYVLLDDLLPCLISSPAPSGGGWVGVSQRGRVGGSLLPLGCVQGANAAATQEPRETIAGIDKAAKPLVQVAPGDSLGEPT